MVSLSLLLQITAAASAAQSTAVDDSVGVFTCIAGEVAPGTSITDDTPARLDRPFSVRVASFESKIDRAEADSGIERDGFEVSDPTDILIGFKPPVISVGDGIRSLTIIGDIDEYYTAVIRIEPETGSKFKFLSYYAHHQKLSGNDSKTTLYSEGRLVGNCDLTQTKTAILVPKDKS
jgi:hypothetical protein